MPFIWIRNTCAMQHDDLLGWRDLNPCRFWPAGFRSCRVKTLANTSSIRCGLCLAWTKISSGKTALHPTVDNFWAIFVFWGAGLLTQVKTKRAKSAEKGHWRATWVWIPSAYNCILLKKTVCAQLVTHIINFMRGTFITVYRFIDNRKRCYYLRWEEIRR